MIDAHVLDGKITKITTDTSEGTPEHPPLRACVKGFHYHETFLNEEKRLKKPMIRTGKRGEGKFREASWEEAIDLITGEWIRIRDTYGPASRYVHYGWGVSGTLRPLDLAKRLLILDGGYQNYYNSYSTAAIHYVTPYLYGTKFVGSSYSDLLNSGLIVLWGHNPADTKFDTLMYYLSLAKKQGIPIICIDPRRHDTCRILDAEWIGLRPATDAALADALAYVMITEELYDQEFIQTFCQGFTAETMPEGYEGEEDYFSYCLGKSDGIPKTPEWAEEICGTEADVIRKLARRMAEAKPMALLQGYGAQRNQNGEQGVRGGIMLACLTGNVGVQGGSAGGSQLMINPPVPEIEELENPVRDRIPVYSWTDAVAEGQLKMILNLAGNALINQHGDINRTKEILKDESLCELIVCSDLFMTASVMYADVLLPGISFLEMNNITSPWVQGDFIGFNNKVVEPIGEGRFEYDWLKEIARKLGLYEAFTEGHETGDEWLEDLYSHMREKDPSLPEYREARKKGIYRYEIPAKIAFQEQREHPETVPFDTPSGKIEIFSPRLADLQNPAVPAIPKYVPAKEGWEDGAYSDYPLQLIGYHTKRRCHSIHGNNEAMDRIELHAVHLNASDAEARGIREGDFVLVYNDRGCLRLPARVSENLFRGVAAIPQGAWYRPDETGVDTGGNINVLTSLNQTPLARGNAQHTNRVEIIKADLKKQVKELPESPGVYLMHNETGEIIYVGKAINLKARVSQYFHHNETRQKRIQQMIASIRWFEYIRTETELEALILESNLIKKYRPRYNAALRKDENHPYLRVDLKEDFPVIRLTTENYRDEALYIGPFYKSMEPDKALDQINHCLGLRNCNKTITESEYDKHPCLYTSLGQCLAPCLGSISKEAYHSRLKLALRFFIQRDSEGIREELTARMQEASAAMEFEKALRCRNMLEELQTCEKKLDFSRDKSSDTIDLFSIAVQENEAVVLLYILRNQRLSGRDLFRITLPGDAKLSEAEILKQFLERFYTGAPYIPDRVFVTEEIDKEMLEKLLLDRKGRRVVCSLPSEGEFGRFAELARESAIQYLA